MLELNKYFEEVGQYNPTEKVYIKMGKNSDEFLTFVVVFVLTHLSKLAFGKNLLKYHKSNNVLGPAMAKHRKILLELIGSSRFIDGHVFTLGILALMKQFTENMYLVEFVQVLAACLLEMMDFNLR